MKTLILLFLINLSYGEPRCYPKQEHRKYYHIGASALSQMSTYGLFRVFGVSQRTSFLVSGPLAMIPGIAKEWYDYKTKDSFDSEDMLHNFLGVLLGLHLVVIWEM